jgi:3-oxoacyl-[acyl-carrier-protein] synthase III
LSYISGFGGYVPDRIVTNDDWAAVLDTSDEWITTRTGIKTRRFAADDQSTVDLAAAAATIALADAGLEPTDLDEIIVATDTPEVMTPDAASFLQHRLGARNIPAFDLGGSGCAGFVQALDVARARLLLRPGRILVVGVELITRLITMDDRATAVLFGDGAGAVVMTSDPGTARLLQVVAGTDGSRTDILTVRPGGTLVPITAELAASGEHKRLIMNGGEVFKEAVRRMSAAVGELLESIDRSPSEVAMVIPHQANKRIIDAVGARLAIDPSRVYINVQDYGNTGSASVPLALWEARSKGLIATGDLVVLTAFGAGFHWAAAAIQF